jgi:hypothetical protein
MKEHRLARRVDVVIPVELYFEDCGDGDGRETGLALNLARGGLFVWTRTTPRRTGRVTVSMRVRTPKGESEIQFPAVVVQRAGLGLGLKFRELDPTASEVLERLIGSEALPEWETDLARGHAPIGFSEVVA